jgi:hypothetical protein
LGKQLGMPLYAETLIQQCGDSLKQGHSQTEFGNEGLKTKIPNSARSHSAVAD